MIVQQAAGVALLNALVPHLNPAAVQPCETAERPKANAPPHGFSVLQDSAHVGSWLYPSAKVFELPPGHSGNFKQRDVRVNGPLRLARR